MAGRAVPIGFAIAVVVVALNQRLAVASVGPILDQVQHSLGLSSAGASALTAAPVFCFGLLALVAPRIARRLGLHRAVLAVVATVTVGLVIRIGPDIATLFIGTVIAAAGIATANVLLPVLVKRDFPEATGTMMGLYTTAVVGSAAIGAGLTVPIADAIGHGWRGGLGIWVAAAAIAFLLWLPHARADRPLVAEPERPAPGLWRDPMAWAVTAFFGMQSLSFYAVLNWLPSLYQDHGYSAASAGGLLSLTAFVQLPIALVLPTYAERARDQRVSVAFATGFTAIGFLGLWLAPTKPAVLWVVLLGIGQGAAFAVGLLLIVMRTRSHGSTAQLSSMAQSVGYLIAGLGPLFVGALHSWTGGWGAPLVFLLVLTIPQLVSGLAAGSTGYVTAGAGITVGVDDERQGP